MIRTRDAESDDAAGIANVHVETWRSTYAGVLPDDYLVGLSVPRHAALWSHWLNDTAADHRLYVAAAPAGDIVGFASCGRLRERKQFHGKGRIGEIYALYVLPDFQGRGLGRALLMQSFAGLSESAHDSAILWVLAANPSRFFYEAMGGRQVGGRKEKFAGTKVAELAYGWDSLVVNQDRP